MANRFEALRQFERTPAGEMLVDVVQKLDLPPKLVPQVTEELRDRVDVRFLIERFCR